MNGVPSFQTVMKWSDDECRAYLETIRWPKGARCPKCGAENPYKITRKAKSKNRLSSLYKCRSCKKQFTATVGTIFEDSKIPLSKWFAAIALMCSSKKGISAHQLYRMLDLGSYRTAWFMCHRVREAMAEKIQLPFEGTVEADATFVGGKHRRGHRVYWERVEDEISLGIRRADGSLKQGKNLAGKPHPRTEKAPVLGIVERGGKARTWVLKGKDESATEIRLHIPAKTRACPV